MKIIIIGAGLGGLSAAFCFARKGHEVHLLERSTDLSPQGGGINIRPGASRILRQWGLDADLEKISVKTPTVLLRNMTTGDISVRRIAINAAEDPDWGTSRQEVIKLLHQRAVEAGADIRFNATVVDVHDGHDSATVVLRNGNTLTADMVLLADGIRSRLRPKILADLPDAKDPILSRTTFYGVEVSASELKKASGTKRLMDNVAINAWMGQDGFVITRYNPTLGNVGLLYAINSETDQKGLWDEDGDIHFVRKFFQGSCSELTAALRVANSCDRWKLAELPDLARWTSRQGRVLLLGDSAHAMHPNAAQGYSQIVEDIGVLELLVERSMDGAAGVPGIAKIWETLRKPRVDRVKRFSKWNTQEFSRAPSTSAKHGGYKDMKDVNADMDAEFATSRFLKWVLAYDSVGEARKFLDKGKSRL